MLSSFRSSPFDRTRTFSNLPRAALKKRVVRVSSPAAPAPTQHTLSNKHAGTHKQNNQPLNNQCRCEEYHSLKCNDKIYPLLHLCPSSLHIPSSAIDLSSCGPCAPPLTPFQAGNLKHFSTRAVIAPTFIFTAQRGVEAFHTDRKTGALHKKKASTIDSLSSRDVMKSIIDFSQYDHAKLFRELTLLNRHHLHVSPHDSMSAALCEAGVSNADVEPRSPAAHTGGSARTRTRPASAGATFSQPIKRQVQAEAEQKKEFSTLRPSQRVELPTCEILAEFHFSSDCVLSDELLAHLSVLRNMLETTPASARAQARHHEQHNEADKIPSLTQPFVDMFYLNMRALHYLLHVVNVDLNRPLFCGVLQAFVIPRHEQNDTIRVCYTQLAHQHQHASTALNQQQSHSSPSPSHPITDSHLDTSYSSDAADHSSLPRLPSTFHLNISCVCSVLPLHARTFSLSTRAATFDAAFIAVDSASHKSNEQPDTKAKQTQLKSHLLYPKRMPSAYTHTASNPRVSASACSLLIPSHVSSFSTESTAERVSLPASHRDRIELLTLRIVQHLNQIYEQEATHAHAQQQYTQLHSQQQQQQPPNNIQLGYLELYMKFDEKDNLYLLWCRSMKQIISEVVDSPSSKLVRCTQCYGLCASQPVGPAPLIQPSSQHIYEQVQQHAARQQLEQEIAQAQQQAQQAALEEYRQLLPDPVESRKRFSHLSHPAARRSSADSYLSRAQLAEQSRVLREQQDRELWPESHFEALEREQQLLQQQMHHSHNNLSTSDSSVSTAPHDADPSAASAQPVPSPSLSPSPSSASHSSPQAPLSSIDSPIAVTALLSPQQIVSVSSFAWSPRRVGARLPSSAQPQGLHHHHNSRHQPLPRPHTPSNATTNAKQITQLQQLQQHDQAVSTRTHHSSPNSPLNTHHTIARLAAQFNRANISQSQSHSHSSSHHETCAIPIPRHSVHRRAAPSQVLNSSFYQSSNLIESSSNHHQDFDVEIETISSP